MHDHPRNNRENGQCSQGYYINRSAVGDVPSSSSSRYAEAVCQGRGPQKPSNTPFLVIGPVTEGVSPIFHLGAHTQKLCGIVTQGLYVLYAQ